jgi:hypothetical protein
MNDCGRERHFLAHSGAEFCEPLSP